MQRKLTAYLYLVPALAFVGFFLLAPMVRTFFYSFTDYRGLVSFHRVGLENYVTFLNDPAFLRSFINTLVWVVATLAFPVLGGLLLAVIVRGVALEELYKSVIFLPLTISFVTTGIIWGWMFSSQLGVINRLLEAVGLAWLRQSWLAQYPLNTFAMIVAWTWQSTGLNMVLFLMGLTTMATEPLEAAMIDGASPSTVFLRVVLPMLRPITTVVVGIALINSFKVFDLIYVMTNGGPARRSEVLAVTMFRESFTQFRMGYGAAISIVLAVLVLLVSTLYVRQMALKEER
jgi:ABC-type sugar transport system permease subunit